MREAVEGSYGFSVVSVTAPVWEKSFLEVRDDIVGRSLGEQSESLDAETRL